MAFKIIQIYEEKNWKKYQSYFLWKIRTFLNAACFIYNQQVKI